MTTFNLPYRYAQRSSGTTRDYVFFAAQDPTTDDFRLKRKRIYIDHIKDKQTRDRHAKKLISHINNLLDAGKNPFVDQEENKKYTSMDKALTFVMDFKGLYIRNRTKHSFDSRMKILKAWLNSKNLLHRYIFEFTEDNALDMMNHLVTERKISGRTYNNYLMDYRTFFNTLVKNKYITTNAFHAVEKLPTEDVNKRPFKTDESNRYFEFVINNDYRFYILSLYCYYLALRPAEICRMKISDFWLDKGVVIVPAGKSKNKKKRIIPIAKPFLPVLEEWFDGLPSGFYVCSKKLKPGNIFEHSTRIAERFREIANDLQIPKEVKFYSLKDTAADKLLDQGFTLKTIRDLFGHSSIAATDAYIKKIRNTIDLRLIEGFPKPYETQMSEKKA